MHGQPKQPRCGLSDCKFLERQFDKLAEEGEGLFKRNFSARFVELTPPQEVAELHENKMTPESSLFHVSSCKGLNYVFYAFARDLLRTK